MSDGQFSSKPMRSERARDSAWRADGFTNDPALLTDSARAFMQSRLLQRELNALSDQPMPAVGRLDCAALPANTPAGAGELGKPLASATLVQEYLIGLLFLRFWGWVFMFFGVIFILSAVINVITLFFERGPNDRPNPLVISVVIGAFGLAIGGAGLWFGILRGRVIMERCWFCPRGMIWMNYNNFDWFAWEEVREVYCRPDAERPAIGIRFDQNLSTISFSNTRPSRLMVEYIENRASAACAQAMVNIIADGRAIRFGEWRLSQASLRGPDGDMQWREVVDVQFLEREIRVRRHGDGAEMIVFLDEVPFPSLFVALVRGIHAFARETASEL